MDGHVRQILTYSDEIFHKIFFFLLVQKCSNFRRIFSENLSSLWGLNGRGSPLSSLSELLLYLAGPVCPASHQSLTKFWLTLPIVAGVPDFVQWECENILWNVNIFHAIFMKCILHFTAWLHCLPFKLKFFRNFVMLHMNANWMTISQSCFKVVYEC